MADPRRRSKYEKQQERRIKRRQIEESYREYVPPQVRLMRQQSWMARVNPDPQTLRMPWRPMGRYTVNPYE